MVVGKTRLAALILICCLSFPALMAQEKEGFPVKAAEKSEYQQFRMKSNVLPWALAIPNLGMEFVINKHWSASMELLFCPWKISDKFSIKTVALLPEGRWWLKSTHGGSFFNVHLNVAWFNVRANAYRYQDTTRPLLGAGIGYGYRLNFNKRWGMEFEIGAGVSSAKYDRYYNIENGALKDTRVSTIWGIDRAAVSVTYYICDL